MKCQDKHCKTEIVADTNKILNFCDTHQKMFDKGMQELIEAYNKNPQKMGDKLTDSIIKPLRKKVGA